jgi:hypothetical protein
MKGHKFNFFYPSGPRDLHSAELGHELGNVLNGLLGMAELLGDTGLNTEQSQWLEAIVHSGQQMQSLIQSEWNALQQSTSNPVPCPELVDGVRLLEQVLTSHIPAARCSNNCVYLNIGADVPRYWECDPCLVRQILDNVLGNALKFTRNGDIQVEVLTRPPEGTLLFRISDTGPGFGAKHRKLPGVAEHGESANNGAGPDNQGLGLPICHRIINALDGELRITSPGGTGAQIDITLPGILHDFSNDPRLECSLFRLIRCRLSLDGPLLPGVRNMLHRLGVERTGGHPPRPGDCLVIELSEQFRGPGRGDREILLCPVTECGPGIEGRALALPLLESSLGPLLLEMVLTWRTQLLRNDSPDSSPAQRQSGQTGVQDPHRE